MRATPLVKVIGRHLAAIAIAFLVVLLLRALVVDVYRVPSESMSPTLRRGDWIAVERLRYGPTLPLLTVRLPRLATPGLTDIIVFSSDNIVVPRGGQGGQLVKRIVGLPGDTLFMRRGILFLNGSTLPFAATRTLRRGPDMSTVATDWMQSRTLLASRFGPGVTVRTLDTWGPLIVPADSVFVLGDNRYSTVDSRHFGFVPLSAVKGIARLIYFSVGRDATGDGFAVRLSRIGLI